MKQLVGIIKSQIQQLTIPALRDWLLSHLNEDTNNLAEFFCKQFPVQLNRVKAPLSSTIRFPKYLAVFPIIYAYAPEQLCQQLTEKLQFFPKVMDEVESQDSREMSSRFCELLNDFREAWPIIVSMQQQGANELIQILDKADERALMALTRLNKDIDFSVLLKTYLIKNSKDLEAVNRNRLIQFLRQPDFSGWFTRYLDSFVNQSAEVLSLRLLLLTFNANTNELEKLKELSSCIETYPFPIHLETMWAICCYFQFELQQNGLSSVSTSYILLLHDLLNRRSLAAQIEFIKGINLDYYLLIIDFCLKGCAQGNLTDQHIYMNLLYLLCSESVVPNKECLKLIKNRLMQQDDYLFESPQLQQLARSVQVELKENSEQSFGGLWIEQLLISPRFVSASSSTILKNLIDRYALLCSVLNQDEYFKLIFSFNEYSSNTDELQEHMQRINQKVLKQSDIKEEWLSKQFKLLKNGIESRVNALLLQLEDQCNQPETNHAEQALQVLYSYYNLVYSNLRFDLMIRAVDYHYQNALNLNKVLANKHNGVLQGFNYCFPQPNDAVKELQRKKELFLYNSAGQKIGFVTESNEAMAFVGEELVLLIQTGSVRVDEPVFDKTCTVIGYLTESGQIRSVEGFQREISARILGLVPAKDLDRSPLGLDLLIQHVLFENTLEVLYGYEDASAGTSKHQWLERRISKTVENLQKNINPLTLNSLISNFSDEGVFELLANIQYKANAIQLFHSILKDDKKREQLFSGLYEADFHRFLKHHTVELCLAEYMAQYYDKPWFADGLMHFAYYGKKNKIDNLLSQSLALLCNSSCIDDTQKEHFDTLLSQLIGSEACAAIVLKEFLNDRIPIAVQKVKNPEISQVTQYYYKKHLIAVIQKLNKTSYWERTAQYKLLLHILDKQHSSLFAMTQSFPLSIEPWQSTELNELSLFINRHLSKKRSLDNECSIGHRILGELIFRSASLGQISLFYFKKRFNSDLARLSFTRPYLERLVDKFWIPEGIKEQIVDEVSRIKEWFKDQDPLSRELKDNQILLDWRHLVHQTWKEINKKKLPMICAYLLNYAGQKNPLVLLLHDYFRAFQNKPEYLHPVSKLLQQFPHRDVSFIIFETLEAAIIKNPQILDLTILRDMAQFYAKKVANQEMKSPEAELNLLIYFGQNKHYALVRQGCDVLAQSCIDKDLKQRLAKGMVEAAVEESLSLNLGQFYFGFIKTIIRLWHYGINAEKNTSKIVKFCDDSSPGPIRKKAAAEVKIPVESVSLGSQCKGFRVKRKQLTGLLDAVKRSSVQKIFEIQPSKVKHKLFGCAPDAAFSAPELVVASKQDAITI